MHGRAHAHTPARHGSAVSAVDITNQIDSAPYGLSTPDDLAQTASDIEALGRRVLGVQADVRSQDQLDAAVSRGLAKFGQIDILIANAGIWAMALFGEITETQRADMIGTNLSGVWRSAKAVAPHMIERKTGAIVIWWMKAPKPSGCLPRNT